MWPWGLQSLGVVMREYDALIGAIYDCAANPDLWPDALTLIRDHLNLAYVMVGAFDLAPLALGQAPKALYRHSPWDHRWIDTVMGYVSKIPDGDAIMQQDLDTAWVQTQRVAESEYVSTDFYKEWVKPQGLWDCINVPYLKRSQMVGLLTMPTYKTRAALSETEHRMAERLSPHIRRAMLINDMSDKDNLSVALHRRVLDSLSVAVFVIGLGRRVVFANAAADTLLAENNFFAPAGGTLVPTRAMGSPCPLDDAIDRASRGDAAIGIAGIGVPLLGRDGDRAAAYILPIAGKDIRGSMGNGYCAVFVARRNEQQPMAMEILRTLFDFTQAEARIALFISQGDGPAAIAAALGLSINTVRSHLAHAYAKSGATDQTSLSGLVNAIIPPVSGEKANGHSSG